MAFWVTERASELVAEPLFSAVACEIHEARPPATWLWTSVSGLESLLTPECGLRFFCCKTSGLLFDLMVRFVYDFSCKL